MLEVSRKEKDVIRRTVCGRQRAHESTQSRSGEKEVEVLLCQASS